MESSSFVVQGVTFGQHVVALSAFVTDSEEYLEYVSDMLHAAASAVFFASDAHAAGMDKVRRAVGQKLSPASRQRKHLLLRIHYALGTSADWQHPAAAPRVYFGHLVYER
jgi:hypothetical protein